MSWGRGGWGAAKEIVTKPFAESITKSIEIRLHIGPLNNLKF
jgi:hypothetical protein